MLYYGFSVLLVPMVDELHSTRAGVAGAFSVGLLVMALVAPQIGRWVDRDHAPRVMRVGAWIAVGGALAASQVPGVVSLYVVWAILGLAMASLFYEPALGLVIHTVSVLTYEDVFRTAWNRKAGSDSARDVQAAIRKLRQKLGRADVIETLPKVGLRLAAP